MAAKVKTTLEAYIFMYYGIIKGKKGALDLYAAVFPSEQAALAAFEKTFGIDYDEYLRLLAIARLVDDLVKPEDDADYRKLVELKHLFWDEPGKAGVYASKMVTIEPISSRVKMLVGAGSL
jgi:hypothetical protein